MTTTLKSRKATNVTKIVQVIERFIALNTGLTVYTVCSATIKNDARSEHFYNVTQQRNGTYTCMSDEPCKEQMYSKSHICKHIQAVQEQDRYEREAQARAAYNAMYNPCGIA